MSFRLPTLDSPSTPNRKRQSLFNTQPSTTPQAPPPTYLSNPSTTPAGAPPTSLFGSSRRGTSRLTFGPRSSGQRGFNAPSSPPDYEDDEDEEEDAPGEEEEEMAEVPSPGKSAFLSSMMSSARGLKRSRNGEPREQHNSEIAAVARGIARQSTRPARLHESDDVVLRQNEILSHMDSDVQHYPRDLDTLVATGAERLQRLWAGAANTNTKEGAIGPESNVGLDKAEYIASLLLQVHHPTSISSNRTTNSKALAKREATCPVPRALLDWLDVHHQPFPDDFDAIHLHQPSPSDHERFWDVVYASLSRGKLDRAIKLLRDAGWENAVTAMEDFPQSQPQGYSGKQLENVEEVVADCLEVLQLCPAVVDGDWDIKGQAWELFRHRVRQATRKLEAFAGEEEDLDQSNMFQRSARMSAIDDFSLTAASRRAESKVPWSVFENLKLVYGLMLGGVDELLDTSQDWLEATIFLTAWWDGADETNSKKGAQKPREVDVSPLNAYRRRLADSLDLVTNEEGTEAVLQVNTMDPVQVALASALDDAVEGALKIICTWSLTVATAVVEIAAWAGWLPQGRPRSAGLLQQGFSSEDLMVLSHGPGQQPPPSSGELDRDEILLQYIDLLKQKEVFTSRDGKNTREGWELAVSLLGRLDDMSAAQRRIDDLLSTIELTDEARVNRVLDACHDLELTAQGRAISERYADTLATSLQTCGPALMFYARAHAGSKIKDMLKNMTSMCLLHSAAIPSQADLDEQLASLLGSERPALVQLARSDSEAAALLVSHLSGYATLRKFYELRDGGSKSLERQREAASSLVAVTESAADCIRGGLFDRSVESAVSVDGVLALLGEALPLLGQKKRIFTKDQIFALLRIVEDFATGPGRIRENAESLLQASITAYREANSGSGMLKKTRSNVSSRSGLTGSSYDMLASSVMAQSTSGSKVERAWDWRKGLDGFTAHVGAKEVLTLLRLALAQEIGRGWSGELNW